jgi:hypothetical protein
VLGWAAMDPYSRLFIRMAMWLRHPPSKRALTAMLAALVLALGLVAVERWIGWPDWARSHRAPIIRHAP